MGNTLLICKIWRDDELCVVYTPPSWSRFTKMAVHVWLFNQNNFISLTYERQAYAAIAIRSAVIIFAQGNCL